MKNKLTRKLVLYFSLTLLIFSLVIGIAFSVLFSKQTITIHTEEMTRRAAVIAETLDGYFSKNDRNEMNPQGGKRHGMGMGMGYGSFIQFMDKLAMDDIWIVDENANTITIGSTMHHKEYSELPDNAQNVIKKVYQGKTTTSEEFSNVLGEPTVTVGAPIKNTSGEILAVVLLHSSISAVHKTQHQGYLLLFISILIAWIIGLLLSIIFSRRFIAPISKMSSFTEELVVEHYDTELDVHTNDEIGALGKKMTILKNRLAEAKFERDNKEKAQKNFLSTISHELRTPVTVIRGSIESLNDGVISEPAKVKQYYEQLLSESVVLERLINDLLELSRLENPEFTITMEQVNVVDIITDSIRSLRVRASEKNQLLEFDNQFKESIIIEGDYGRIRQLFIIILENALKFSPESTAITVEMKKIEQRLVVSIHNQGSFISEEEKVNIFERFRKIDADKRVDGTGLGLAIAKEIAERHQFNLSVESDREFGTTFIVKIPCN
ncbi:sensor histidine kinase [Enterococcus rivorum]|uniref:histidine kinase n=2 Tax=Enterococcus rivorum TaxID=762845 RepID=A0A1E5KVD8_9ENTE|nr:HAMP domain-containing sensor histidine kinase [Enterococcus rivorum]MBP2100199.1 signal transduction histidine kinase [Enterococcus rivorum]OEH81790.1 two-component sensor histidine kinase [Enterococcus rivorum]